MFKLHVGLFAGLPGRLFLGFIQATEATQPIRVTAAKVPYDANAIISKMPMIISLSFMSVPPAVESPPHDARFMRIAGMV
jgi:hypothetical protein